MEKTGRMDLLKRLYPDARSIKQTEGFIKDVIEVRLGMNVNNLICFTSLAAGNNSGLGLTGCPVVEIGGLGGFPFQGLSALSLFPENMHNDDAVLILYAADIGLNDGSAASPERVQGAKRQHAVNKALEKMLANKILPDHVSELDYQMNFIEQILNRDQRRIRSADYPLFEAAEVMYEAIERRMKLLVAKTNYPCKYVILLGAIQYLDQTNCEAQYVLKHFSCINSHTKENVVWGNPKESNLSV